MPTKKLRKASKQELIAVIRQLERERRGTRRTARVRRVTGRAVARRRLARRRVTIVTPLGLRVKVSALDVARGGVLVGRGTRAGVRAAGPPVRKGARKAGRAARRGAIAARGKIRAFRERRRLARFRKQALGQARRAEMEKMNRVS